MNANSDDIEPMYRTLRRHIFEVLALSLTCVGILGYSSGMAFAKGWFDMAGVPVEYFPRSLQEIVRIGLINHTPWLYSLVFIVVLVNYVNLANALEAWWKVAKAKRSRNQAALAARAERLALGVAERRSGLANKKWRNLGRRGDGLRPPLKVVNAGVLRKRPITKHLLAVLLSAVIASASVGGYIFLNSFFSGVALVEGRRTFLGTYAAVTGKFPVSVDQRHRTDRELKDLACSYRSILERYGSVTLADGKTSAYILQAAGNSFLFLTKDGLILKTFGDNGFELRESLERPMAKVLELCQQ